MAGAALMTEAEIAPLAAAGEALWAACRTMVNTGPHYAGVSGQERAAAIARATLQATIDAIVRGCQESGEFSAYPVISALGRSVGDIFSTGDPRAVILFEEEVNKAVKDVRTLLKPAGRV